MKMPAVSGGDFEKCPVGNHLAVCFQVIDLGTQTDVYEGETSVRRKVWLAWEVSGEADSEGRPFTVGKEYTLSSHERSKLRQHLESWRSAKFSDDEIGHFEISSVIGVGCYLSVVPNSNGNPSVSSVSALPKGTKAPASINPPMHVELTSENYDPVVVESVPAFLLEKIKGSPEYAQLASDPMPADSTPF